MPDLFRATREAPRSAKAVPLVTRLSPYCLRMIFSENRGTPRIKCGAGFFRIMR
jgi:hypothetical protein